MASVLDQAIGGGQQIQSAATGMMASDPLSSEFLSRLKGQDTADDEAAAEVQAKDAQIEKLSQPEPRPSVPRLTPLPAYTPPPPKDPMRVLGQFLPLMVAFGALKTRQPALNAMKAATGAINAAKAKDQDELERYHVDFKTQLGLALSENQQTTADYKMILDDRNLSILDKQAQISALAASKGDSLVLAQLKGHAKGLEAMEGLMKFRDASTHELTGLYDTMVQESLTQKKLENDRFADAARLELDKRKANNISMGDAVGTILAQIAARGPESLTDGQRAAMKQYMELNASGTESFAERAAKLREAREAAAKAAADAAAAKAGGVTAAPTAAPATGAGEVTAIPDATYALHVARAKAALGRPGVSRDQVRAVWIQSGLPEAEFDKRVK